MILGGQISAPNNNQPHQRILERIAGGDLHRELIAGGFSGGQEERLAAIVNSYSDFVARLDRF